MGADDGAVQHQPFKIGTLAKLLEQAVDQAALQPSVIAPFDRLESAEVRRQILPSRPGASHPKQRIDETTVVGPRPTLAFATTGDQRQNSRPLIVTKLISIQQNPPKYRLGSSSWIKNIRQEANCHYGLDLPDAREYAFRTDTSSAAPH